MRKPEQTTEPSIEEILASIRRIIADEGNPTAPAFNEAAAGAMPQRQPHYDEYRDGDVRFDERYDEPRGREPSSGRDPHYGAPRRESRYQDELRYDEPRHNGYEPEPRDGEYGEPNGRAGFRGGDERDYERERSFDRESNYERNNGFEHDARDYRARDHFVADFERGGDFNSADFERHDGSRLDFDGDIRAKASFDPYATEQDFGTKPLPPVSGNDDEILELTEDFMVEEAASAGAEAADTYDTSYDAALDDLEDVELSVSYLPPRRLVEPDPAPAAPPFIGLVSDTSDALPQEDELLAPVAASMSPIAEEPFAGAGLDSVLSNVVAEMQRLSESTGRNALADDSAFESETVDTPEGIPAHMEEPQPRSWQPKARPASTAPVQRPVWSARRRDSGDGNTQPPAPAVHPSADHERSPSATSSPNTTSSLVGSEIGTPFGEVLAPKKASAGANSARSQAGAPTALARDANLKVDAEEMAPDLSDGDLPPEVTGESGEQLQNKPTVKVLAAVRAARQPATASPEETPELPSDADDETVVQPQAPAPKAAVQPETVAPKAPVAAAQPVPVPAASTVEKAVSAPATVQAAPVANMAAEQIAAAALPDGLEDGVRELLKPLIAEWLKQNLPRLTEEVLREEVRRTSPLAKQNSRA